MMAELGCLLSLDVGERRIGVAVSDAMQILARPLTVIHRKTRVEDFATIKKLVEEHQAILLICGHPLSLDGFEGPQGRRIRRFAEALQETLPIPINLWDESFSTVQADHIMGTNKKRVKHKDRKKRVDAVAAAVILQNYLESGIEGSLSEPIFPPELE